MIEVGAQTREAAGGEVDRLVLAYGGSMSNALFEPGCRWFRAAGIDGTIAYRLRHSCAVVLGEPLCLPEERSTLAEVFRHHCAESGYSTMFVAVANEFATQAIASGYAAVEFAATLVLDPRDDPRRGRGGRRGRKLRNRLRRAEAAPLTVSEYRPAMSRDPDLEQALSAFARQWLSRHGGPLALGSIRLFEHAALKRWFYASTDSRIAALLSLVRVPRLGGYLVDDFLCMRPAAPGTSEHLVVTAAEILGGEGAALTFGPLPRPELGRITGLRPRSERFARRAYHLIGRVSGFQSLWRYPHKFGAREEPSLLLFHPPRIRMAQLLGLVSAFRARRP